MIELGASRTHDATGNLVKLYLSTFRVLTWSVLYCDIRTDAARCCGDVQQAIRGLQSTTKTYSSERAGSGGDLQALARWQATALQRCPKCTCSTEHFQHLSGLL